MRKRSIHSRSRRVARCNVACVKYPARSTAVASREAVARTQRRAEMGGFHGTTAMGTREHDRGAAGEHGSHAEWCCCAGCCTAAPGAAAALRLPQVRLLPVRAAWALGGRYRGSRSCSQQVHHGVGNRPRSSPCRATRLALPLALGRRGYARAPLHFSDPPPNTSLRPSHG